MIPQWRRTERVWMLCLRDCSKLIWVLCQCDCDLEAWHNRCVVLGSLAPAAEAGGHLRHHSSVNPPSASLCQRPY